MCKRRCRCADGVAAKWGLTYLGPASSEFAELLPLVEATRGREYVTSAVFSSESAACYLADQRFNVARERLETVLPALEARFGPGHARTREAYGRLAQAYQGLGDAARSAGYKARAEDSR